MTELSRHIEILLLENDCVIVPGFGGIMAHHIPARYDDETNTFIPPHRTLGFNPQLQVNDSLLVQSYIEAYDISYPEALSMIETEVDEVKQALAIDGEYFFHGIGTVTLMSDSRFTFEPATSGIATPFLYALDSFPLEMLEPEEEVEESKEQPESKSVLHPAAVAQSENTEDEAEDYEDSAEEESDSIRISLPLVRKITAAAAVISCIIFSSIPVGRGSSNISTCSMIDTELISSIVAKSSHNAENRDFIAAQEPSEAVTTTDSNEPYFTIVMASKVSRRGGEAFINTLAKQGMKDGRIDETTSMRRVLYGKYSNRKEAQKVLAQLRNTQKEAMQAWIAEVRR